MIFQFFIADFSMASFFRLSSFHPTFFTVKTITFACLWGIEIVVYKINFIVNYNFWIRNSKDKFFEAEEMWLHFWQADWRNRGWKNQTKEDLIACSFWMVNFLKFEKIGCHFRFLSLADFRFFCEWFIQIRTVEEDHWSLPLLKDWLWGFLFIEKSIKYWAL